MAEEPETASSSLRQSAGRKPEEDASKGSQVPAFSGFPQYFDNEFQMRPVMYPVLVPGLTPVQYEEQMNRGAGIYAVPVLPFMGQHVAGLPANNLIPLTYNIPTTRASNETGSRVEAHGQAGGQQQGQQQQPAAPRQVVVRRFHIAFQLDLLLILKLAAVIFLFNQDGSRQRLAVLVFFASLVYLYQTGALAPLVRWLSQGMQRAAAPPQPQRPPVRADNAHAAAGQGNEYGPVGEGQAGEGNEVRPPNDGHQAAENVNPAGPGGELRGNQWWGIVKEIQMIVFGFITSLLPGFHNID